MQNKNKKSSQIRKERKAKMDSCMKNAKNNKEKLRCKRLHSNPFDPISRESKLKKKLGARYDTMSKQQRDMYLSKKTKTKRGN